MTDIRAALESIIKSVDKLRERNADGKTHFELLSVKASPEECLDTANRWIDLNNAIADARKSLLAPVDVSSLKRDGYRQKVCTSQFGPCQFYDTGYNQAIDDLQSRGLIVREGYVVVPREPTLAMINAGQWCIPSDAKGRVTGLRAIAEPDFNENPNQCGDPVPMYKAMISAGGE